MYAESEADYVGEWAAGKELDLKWLHYLVWDVTSQDNAKDATGPLITLQTWALGQMVAMMLYVHEHPKPYALMTFIFLALTAVPLVNLFLIVWAGKTSIIWKGEAMKVTQQYQHFYEG